MAGETATGADAFRSDKVAVAPGERPESQIGATIDALAQTIRARRQAGNESYTHRLLEGDLDALLKKLVEEAHETTLAAKDAAFSGASPADVDHLRYEAADVVYHLLVVLERFEIPIEEFAAELNARMALEELAEREGYVMLKPEHVNRGKRDS